MATKRPRGRPPLPPGERGERLTVRLPGALRVLLEADAEQRGETLTQYVQAAVRDRLAQNAMEETR